MIRIYKSQNNGEFIIQTDAMQLGYFTQDLSSAILRCLEQMSGDEEHTLLSDIGTIAARPEREIEVTAPQLDGFQIAPEVDNEKSNQAPRKEPRW